jgi:transposase-like protein
LVDAHNGEGRMAFAGVPKMSRARRTFTAEFKTEAVAA